MENKNTKLIILIVILSLLVIGLGSFVVYDKLFIKNKELSKEKTECVQEENKNKQNIEKKLVSIESIKELSKNNSLNINTDFSMLDGTIGYYGKNNSNNDYVTLSVNNDNRLVFKHANNTSLIQNFDEEVIDMSYTGVDTQTYSTTTLILTSSGNLYAFNNNDHVDENVVVNKNISDAIDNNSKVNAKIIRINGNEKILAFTNYEVKPENDNDIYIISPIIVYTSDGKFMQLSIDKTSLDGEYKVNELRTRQY